MRYASAHLLAICLALNSGCNAKFHRGVNQTWLVYAGAYSTTTLNIFDLDPATHTLTLNPVSPITLPDAPGTPSAFIQTRDRRFLIILERGMPSAVQTYALDSTTGVLGPTPLTTYSVGALIGNGASVSRQVMALSKDETRLFLADSVTSTVKSLAFNRDTGILTETGATPLYGYSTGIAVHPNGRWLYAASPINSELLGAEIRDDGSLLPLGGSPYACGIKCKELAMSPGGGALVAASYDFNDTERVFSIDPTTGSLTLRTSVNVHYGDSIGILFYPGTQLLAVAGLNYLYNVEEDASVSLATDFSAQNLCGLTAGLTNYVAASPDGVYLACNNGPTGGKLAVLRYQGTGSAPTHVANSPTDLPTSGSLYFSAAFIKLLKPVP
ncbi:MAG: beta-propeller fold lactonase family protein [Bacteriovoracia bacterium]